MGSEYRAYLAASILNDERIVTYRILSRALNVHVNSAKEMLFEFHRQQNVKKPGSVHATYLVAGVKRRSDQNGSNGDEMKGVENGQPQSSPFQSSPMPHVQEPAEESPTLCLSLVREEELERVQAQYESIRSIHVYSLEPHDLKDLQILSDSTRELGAKFADQDPLDVATTYGTIVNKAVRRRIGRRPPPSLPSQPPKTQPAKALGTNSTSTEKKGEPTPTSSSTQSSKEFFGKGAARGEAATNPPQLKKESSNIFKSFAKAKPKLQREATDSSAAASGVESGPPSGAEDEPMKDMSDDEEENYVPPVQPLKPADRKSRKEREEELRKMMEEDDDGERMAKPEVMDIEGPTTVESTQNQEAERGVETTGGRRRGKRKVMKKRTIKDEEGYLVTKEEAVWESFSEDEPISKPKSQTPSSSNTAKPKKPPGKGQGSIMSFFAKPK